MDLCLVVGSTGDRQFTGKSSNYTDFVKNNSAKKLLEKPLALHLLPAEHIRVVLTESQSLVHTRSCAITLKRSVANDGHQMTGHSFTE